MLFFGSQPKLPTICLDTTKTKLFNLYNKRDTHLARWRPYGARKWIPFGGIPPRNMMTTMSSSSLTEFLEVVQQSSNRQLICLGVVSFVTPTLWKPVRKAVWSISTQEDRSAKGTDVSETSQLQYPGLFQEYYANMRKYGVVAAYCLRNPDTRTSRHEWMVDFKSYSLTFSIMHG